MSAKAGEPPAAFVAPCQMFWPLFWHRLLPISRPNRLHVQEGSLTTAKLCEAIACREHESLPNVPTLSEHALPRMIESKAPRTKLGCRICRKTTRENIAMREGGEQITFPLQRQRCRHLGFARQPCIGSPCHGTTRTSENNLPLQNKTAVAPPISPSYSGVTPTRYDRVDGTANGNICCRATIRLERNNYARCVRNQLEESNSLGCWHQGGPCKSYGHENRMAQTREAHHNTMASAVQCK
jgi:hypothetical protein